MLRISGYNVATQLQLEEVVSPSMGKSWNNLIVKIKFSSDLCCEGSISFFSQMKLLQHKHTVCKEYDCGPRLFNGQKVLNAIKPLLPNPARLNQ